MEIEIMICCGGRMYCPPVETGIEWTLQRRGVPGVLKFSAASEGLEALSEGDSVTLRGDGRPLFVGFVFRIARDSGGFMKITAYDQMRYLKNRDSYVFEATTASQRITMIAQDFGLRLGAIADTGYVLPERVEENTPLLDMMLSALDATLTATGRLYNLWDEAGELTLKSAEEMIASLVLDAASGESYAWESSIDSQSYNRIKLVYEDEEAGSRQVTLAQDDASMEKWGTLQLFEVVTDGEQARMKADLLLSLYNTPERSLRLKGVSGDTRLRAGSLLLVQLEDIGQNGLMLVEKCSHHFEGGFHSMDLELRG